MYFVVDVCRRCGSSLVRIYEKSKWKLKMTKGGGGLRWEEGGEERDRKGKRGEGRKEGKGEGIEIEI